VLLLCGLCVGGWFAYDAQQARASLQQVAANAQVLQRALIDGDNATADRALADLRSAAEDAEGHTDGPLWALARKLPWAGPNVKAVQAVADVADGLASQTLPPVVSVSDDLELGAFSPKRGRIDLDALQRLAPIVREASEGFASARSDLADVDTSELLASIEEPLAELRDKLDDATRLTRTSATALQILPGMLGAEETRDYLTLFQNNAEIRATGGIPGAVAVIRADNGKLSLRRQATAADFGKFEEPVLQITDEESRLYQNNMVQFFANVNLTPEFPRTAEISREMWRLKFGQSVDGVLSVDPVALSYILEATGPITLADGAQLTSSNAVDLLLNQIYVTVPDPVEQNEYFADAAARVFDAVASGTGDPRLLIEALARGVAEGRIYAWSADSEEQQTLASTSLAGELVPVGGEQPHLGFYLNDATGAKMQYYLEYSVGIDPVACDDEGQQVMESTVSMTSNAPADSAELPESIIGPGFGFPPGTMAVNLTVYAPGGGSFGSVRVDGKKVFFDRRVHEQHPVAVVPIFLRPGVTQVLEVEITSGPDQSGTPAVVTTPGIRPGLVTEVSASAC